MFLDSDILHRKGPLSVIWLVGNGQITESMKNKFHDALNNVKVIPTCNRLYEFFTSSNSQGNVEKQHGFGLKKLAILVNGLTIVHIGQVDVLLQKISVLSIRIHSSHADKIDFDRHRFTRAFLQEFEVVQDALELHDGLEKDKPEDEPIDAVMQDEIFQNAAEGGVMPRISSLFRGGESRQRGPPDQREQHGLNLLNEFAAARTRRAGNRLETLRDESNVLRSGTIYADPSRITMVEVDLPQVSVPEIGFYDEVTGEQDHERFLREMGMSDLAVDTSVPFGGGAQTADPSIEVTKDATNDRDPLGGMEIDQENLVRGDFDMAPPPVPEDNTGVIRSFVLDQLNDDSIALQSPVRRRGFRRVPPRIDQRTTLANTEFKDLTAFVNAGYKIDHDRLLDESARNRPNPQGIRNKTGLDFILDAGHHRPGLGGPLKDMLNETTKHKLEYKSKKVVEKGAAAETGRRSVGRRVNNTTVEDRTGIHGASTSCAAPADVDIEAGRVDGLPSVVGLGINLTGGALGHEDIEMVNPEIAFVPENDPIDVTLYPTPPRYAGQNRNLSPPASPRNEEMVVTARTTFGDLVPPGQPRQRAVKVFAKLLKQQKKKQVLLTQDEFYGPLTISSIQIV